MSRLVAGLAAAVILTTSPAQAQTRACEAIEPALDRIGQTALQAGAPGLVIGVARRDQSTIVRAFGLADVEHGVAMQPGSAFRIASLTKQFTAAVVLSLVEDGRLSLTDRAVDHLPDRPWLGEITVYQLLVQTSGLPDYAGRPEFEADRASPRDPDLMLDRIGQLAIQRDFAPGERWAYSNANYVVLGAIIEKVTGQSFSAAVTDHVLGPAGLGDTAVDDPRQVVAGRVAGYSASSRRPFRLTNAAWLHPSMPGPAGSLRSTAPDLLLWSEALMNQRVLSADQLERMVAPGRLSDGRTTRLGMPQAWQDGLRADYAMGLFASGSLLGARLWHSGDIDGFTTWMAHYPETGVAIVMLQNGDFLDLDHAAVEQAVLDARGC